MSSSACNYSITKSKVHPLTCDETIMKRKHWPFARECICLTDKSVSKALTFHHCNYWYSLTLLAYKYFNLTISNIFRFWNECFVGLCSATIKMYCNKIFRASRLILRPNVFGFGHLLMSKNANFWRKRNDYFTLQYVVLVMQSMPYWCGVHKCNYHSV